MDYIQQSLANTQPFVLQRICPPVWFYIWLEFPFEEELKTFAMINSFLLYVAVRFKLELGSVLRPALRSSLSSFFYVVTRCVV